MSEEFTDAELEGLPIEQRNALTAHVCNHRTYAEIAADQGIPIGTVRSRISRARAHIAKKREERNAHVAEPFRGVLNSFAPKVPS